MIKLKPDFGLTFSCPECGSDNTTILRISVPGIHWLADCTCKCCQLSFLQSLPAGHTINYPIAIGKNNNKLYPDDGKWYWQSEPFLRFFKSFSDIKSNDVSIRKLVYSEHKRVIILNTLDFLYGHTLLKLFNSQYHLDNFPELGLIVIIPKSFEWLIPKGCSEAWIVDLNLNELSREYEEIDKFVTAECNRFEEIYISHAYSHPISFDISRLTGIQPFNLEQFSQHKPFFTFALREDRWWLENKISHGFYWIFKKMKLLKLVSGLLTRRQNSLVRRTIRSIRKNLPNAEFCLTGLGKTGSFGSWILDKRSEKVNAEIEQEWCRLYAKSHVVIGIHGSNMLLPTAFSAGCVEILPGYRTRNIVQDITVRYDDRKQLFFYRFADQLASPRSVACKASAIVLHYDNFYKNMVRNLYRSESTETIRLYPQKRFYDAYFNAK